MRRFRWGRGAGRKIGIDAARDAADIVAGPTTRSGKPIQDLAVFAQRIGQKGSVLQVIFHMSDRVEKQIQPRKVRILLGQFRQKIIEKAASSDQQCVRPPRFDNVHDEIMPIFRLEEAWQSVDFADMRREPSDRIALDLRPRIQWKRQ